MKHLRILLAAVLTAALTTIFLLALAGETETTTASYGYQADTAVGELENPGKTPGDVETTPEPETAPAPETTVPETTVPETEAPATTVPETTAPTPETAAPETTAQTNGLRLLKKEETESVILATISEEDVVAAVAGGKEVRIRSLTAIAVDDEYAFFEYGERTFPVRCPQEMDIAQPVLIYFILV